MKKLLPFLALLLFTTGCATIFTTGATIISTAGGAVGIAVSGVIDWEQGEAHKYYSFNNDIMYKATKRALNDLGLPIKQDQQLGSEHIILAMAGHKIFTIKVSTVTPEISTVSVRVGFMGDKSYAKLIYDNVDR